MSISYWGIQGYGIDIQKEVFIPEKIRQVLGWEAEGETEPFYSGNTTDGFEVLDALLALPQFEKHSKYIDLWNSADAEEGVYLLYSPRNPWDMDDEEKSITEEEIIQMIVDLLVAVTNLTEDTIRKEIEEVSTYGCA